MNYKKNYYLSFLKIDYVTLKTKKNYKNLKIKNYGLIINCDSNIGISKKFFFQKDKKKL